MGHVTRRLARRIEHDFPQGVADDVTLMVSGAAHSERVQAAIVLTAGGDTRELGRQIELAQIDWRDLLVNAVLAEEDWTSVLDQQLGR